MQTCNKTEAQKIVDAASSLLKRNHDRPLVNRLTVAKGYLELLQSNPEIDCEGKLREALTDLEAIISARAA